MLNRFSNRQSRFISWTKSHVGTLALAIVAIAAVTYFALTQPTTFTNLLPFAFLLLCPFLHLFMHGGHNSHGGSSDDSTDHSGHTQA